MLNRHWRGNWRGEGYHPYPQPSNRNYTSYTPAASTGTPSPTVNPPASAATTPITVQPASDTQTPLPLNIPTPATSNAANAVSAPAVPAAPLKSIRELIREFDIKCPFAKPAPLSAYDIMVTIIVGKGNAQETFHLYKGLLCFYSSYFRRALNSRFGEASSGVVKLPEDSTAVFRAFFTWVNTGNLYVPSDDEKILVPLNYRLLYRIFVFGDARGIPQLQNATIDLIFKKNHDEGFSGIIDMAYVYENTMKGSRLRKFLVYWHVYMGNWVPYDNFRKWFPKDFLMDILIAAEKEECLPGSPSGGQVRSIPEWLAKVKPLFCQEWHDHSDPSKD